MKKTGYHYRLILDFPSDSLGVNGITFNKKWTYSDYRIDKVNDFVKTPSNPKGVLECRKVDNELNIIVEDYTVKEAPKPILLPIPKLTVARREKLEEVAESLGVGHIGIITQKLRELIIEKTQEVKKENRKKKLAKEIKKVEKELEKEGAGDLDE